MCCKGIPQVRGPQSLNNLSRDGYSVDFLWNYGALPLLGFVDDFDRPDLGIIHFRGESEQQFALAVGMKTVEFTDHRPKRPRGYLKNVEVLKQQDPVAGNIEDSTTRAAAGRVRN